MKLVTDNLGLVHSIVNRYVNRNSRLRQDEDDLFQVGCIGLIYAAKRFDPSKGFQFSTFAFPYIQNEIRRYFKYGRSLKIPRRQMELNSQIHRSGMEEKSPQEIADYFGVSVRFAKYTLDSLKLKVYSTDAKLETDKGKPLTFADTLPYYADFSAVEAQEMLAELKPRERFIVKCLLQNMTQIAIGKKIGVTQVQVYRLITKIRKKLSDAV